MRKTNFLSIAILFTLSFTNCCAEQLSLKRYLYMSVPDASQRGKFEPGVVVFDIDNGHQFVKHISVPGFMAEGIRGLRGFEGSLANKAAYYSGNKGLLGKLDLITEKVVWEKRFELGIDRASVSQDGKKIYAPTGWWHREDDGGMLVIDEATQTVLKRIKAGGSAHNSFVSLDSKYVFVAGWGWLNQYTTDDETLVQSVIGDEIGDNGVYPYVVDSTNEIAYVSHHDHVGYDMVDLKAGKLLYTMSEVENGSAIARRTHGAGLTPDESEVWISDQKGKRLIIYDNTVFPPQKKLALQLSRGGHGWVTFSNDGKYAWCHTEDVFDVKTKQRIATLQDDKGNPVFGSKFFEAHFRGKELVFVSSQFGLGMKK